MSRSVIAFGLLVAALVGSACDAPSSPAAGESGAGFDEWTRPPPPTPEEILAAPAGHDAEVVVALLVELAERGDVADLPAVLALRDDAREEVRWHVVEALRAIGGPDAADVLTELAASDPSALVREAAEDAR